MNDHINEVDSRLFELAAKDAVADPCGLIRIRLAVPVVRKTLKTPFSFSDLAEKQQLEIWDSVWKQSLYYESMSLALYRDQGRPLSREEFETVVTWIDRITCWEHSDDLSKIIAQVVEENPGWIMPFMLDWNKDENPWKRRQSVVGLIEYASKRKRFLPFSELISFIDPLLDDSEYYVQKGIGWTLREIYNAYPDKTLKYIEKNILNISPNAYTAATEKLDRDIRQKFGAARKLSRKKG